MSMQRESRQWIARYAAFTMSDGSPSFKEWMYLNESLGDFVARMHRITATGGGYVSGPEFFKAHISEDYEAYAQFERVGYDAKPTDAPPSSEGRAPRA